jgi:hypothetical protein
VNNNPLNSTESELLDASLDKPYMNNKGIEVNHDGLKLNCAHQLLFDAKNFITLGGKLHTTKKTIELLLVSIKESGLDIKLSTSS